MPMDITQPVDLAHEPEGKKGSVQQWLRRMPRHGSQRLDNTLGDNGLVGNLKSACELVLFDRDRIDVRHSFAFLRKR